MFDLQTLIDRRNTRRGFLRTAAAGALGLAGAGLLAKGADAAPTNGGIDAVVLNFALNLEYLEAEFYTYAITGKGIEALGIGVNGAGTPGTTLVKANPQVPFVAGSPIAQFAAEIAKDEQDHVIFLRNALAAGGVQPVARPAIDLLNSFNAAAAAAGITQNGFDPFASPEAFLVGAFVFEDVGVTAYHGGAGYIINKNYLSAAAGILAVEAYHASLVRTTIFGLGDPYVTYAGQISALRDKLAGTMADQPIVVNGTSNIVPSDNNSVAFSRTPGQVLNIVYGNTTTTPGGFFPHGMNGAIH